jgi:hypothetical protein
VISRDSQLLNEKGWKEFLRPRTVPDEDEDHPEQRKYFGTRTYA